MTSVKQIVCGLAKKKGSIQVRFKTLPVFDLAVEQTNPYNLSLIFTITVDCSNSWM